MNLDGISFPTSLDDIDTFQKNNDISANVFCQNDEHNKKFIYPRRITSVRTANHNVNWLLLIDEDDDDNQHYTLIKDISRLVRHKGKTYVCN